MDSLKITNNKYYKSSLDLLSKYRIVSKKNQPYILIDGIATSSSNLFINTAIGLAAHEIYSYNIGFLTKGYSQEVSDFAKAIGAKVFDINVFESRNILVRKYRQLKTYLKYGLLSEDNILGLSIGNVVIGDLIYDGIIRQNNNIYTAAHFNSKILKRQIARANYAYYCFNSILKEYDVKLLSLGHKYYTLFGVIARVAIEKNIPFISKTRAYLKLINSQKEALVNNYYISKELEYMIKKIPENIANSYVKLRFGGELEQHDVKSAYTCKNEYAPDYLMRKLQLDDNRPIAVIMPHAFSDAPHCDKSMIYKDYYEWLIETLKIIEEITNIQWLIKPHPSSSIYNEKGVVSELIKKFQNIKEVPKDIKTNSVLKISDAIITVRGTVGLECVLYDVKPILAGDSYYMDLGFTINCKSVKDYEIALRSIKKKAIIDNNIKDLVKKIMYWHQNSRNFYSNIFGPERPPNMPLDEIYEHELSNYKRVYNFLSNNNYKSDKYYLQLLKFFREQKKELSILDLVDFH